MPFNRHICVEEIKAFPTYNLNELKTGHSFPLAISFRNRLENSEGLFPAVHVWSNYMNNR